MFVPGCGPQPGMSAQSASKSGSCGSTSIGSGVGVMAARSEPNLSEASSHISKPKWRRLLRALAQVFAGKLEMAAVTGGPRSTSELEVAFLHPDAGGGGTEFDMYQFMRQLLEDMALSDEDTGAVLIGMYHFAGAPDLPLSACTWRPVFVTALFESMGFCLRSNAKGPQERLLLSVAHWWPKVKADHAHKLFVSRPTYRDSVLTKSERMRCYVELRERSLRRNVCSDSTTTVPSFDLSFDAASVSRRLEVPRLHNRSKGGSSFGNSLVYSEDSSIPPMVSEEAVDNGHESDEIVSI